MKLSKVTKVLELFDITKIDDYRIMQYNPELVPNTHFYNGYDKKHCQVSLMYNDGDIKQLRQGTKTREKAEDPNVIAIFVEYQHMNKEATETHKYEKMLLIK